MDRDAANPPPPIIDAEFEVVTPAREQPEPVVVVYRRPLRFWLSWALIIVVFVDAAIDIATNGAWSALVRHALFGLN